MSVFDETKYYARDNEMRDFEEFLAELAKDPDFYNDDEEDDDLYTENF